MTCRPASFLYHHDNLSDSATVVLPGGHVNRPGYGNNRLVNIVFILLFYRHVFIRRGQVGTRVEETLLVDVLYKAIIRPLIRDILNQ